MSSATTWITKKRGGGAHGRGGTQQQGRDDPIAKQWKHQQSFHEQLGDTAEDEGARRKSTLEFAAREPTRVSQHKRGQVVHHHGHVVAKEQKHRG